MIFGSGAIENSWAPILKCLTPHNFTNDITKDAANSALASLVYNLRFHTSESNNDDNINKCQIKLKNKRKDLCDYIQYYQESGQMRVRKELYEIIDTMIIPYCENLLFITTNWDTVVDEALLAHTSFKSLKVIHLHGTCNDPNTLYLPTEVSYEKYRSQEEQQQMRVKHSIVMDQLSFAQMIILYGISFSALDAELVQLFTSSMHINDSLENIKIIDRHPQCVAEKINIMMTHKRKVKIEGFCPEDLHNPTDFSLEYN